MKNPFYLGNKQFGYIAVFAVLAFLLTTSHKYVNAENLKPQVMKEKTIACTTCALGGRTVDVLQELKDDRLFNSSRRDVVWQSYCGTLIIFVSGLVIAFTMALEKYPKSGPFFVVLPFIIMAWFLLMSFQGNELHLRGSYIAIMEQGIQNQIGQPFPCADSRLQPHIWVTMRFLIIQLLIAIPIVLLYFFVCKKSLEYVSGKAPAFYKCLFNLYIALPLVSLVLIYFNSRAIGIDVAALHDELQRGGIISEKGDQPTFSRWGKSGLVFKW